MAGNNRRSQTRRPRRNGRANQSSLIWVWLFLGMFLGVLGAMFAYSAYTRQWANSNKELKTMSQKAQKMETKTPRHLPHKKAMAEQYEFYTLLPGMEVQLPSAPTSSEPAVKQNNETPPKPATGPPPKTTLQVSPEKPAAEKKSLFSSAAQKKVAASHYIIQAGIFREAKSADELKARLTLQGFNTHIQRVRTQNGQSWFRVTLGPFVSEPKAQVQKKRLESQKVKAVLILQRPLQQ